MLKKIQNHNKLMVLQSCLVGIVAIKILKMGCGKMKNI